MGNKVSSTNPLGLTYTSVYDGANRLIGSVDPLGNRTSYNYDKAGNRVSTADPLGNLWTGVYDGQARPIASIDPTGARTSYTYNVANLPTAVTNPLANTASHTYDTLQRLGRHRGPARESDQPRLRQCRQPSGVYQSLGCRVHRYLRLGWSQDRTYQSAGKRLQLWL